MAIGKTEIKNPSLQEFLDFRWELPAGCRGHVLSLQTQTINGKKCTVLKAVDLAKLGVFSLISTWINKNTTLPKVLAFIKEQGEAWGKEKLSIPETREFELQCFWLDRKVQKYNINHPEAPLHFKNPYQGMLYITVRHPDEIGAEVAAFKETVHEYPYDRWALNNDLVARAIEQCKKQPIRIHVPWKESINQEKKELLIEVKPESCFQKCDVMIENEEERNPEGQYQFQTIKDVTITFSDADVQALTGLLMGKGQTTGSLPA